MTKKKVKRKINKRGLFVVLLTLYLLIMAFYYFLNMPIKSIVVKGNNLVSDADIIEMGEINNYSKLFSLNRRKVTKNIQKLELINKVKLRKSILGTLTLDVSETRVLFYDYYNTSYVLEDGRKLNDISNITGIPVLVNYVPSEIYEGLIKKFQNVTNDTLVLISEIEYSPNIKNDVVIDENRFLLRMNDGNYVYINLANFKDINLYTQIYATLESDKKGVLNLDGSLENKIFTTFETIEKEKEEVKEKENELSE